MRPMNTVRRAGVICTFRGRCIAQCGIIRKTLARTSTIRRLNPNSGVCKPYFLNIHHCAKNAFQRSKTKTKDNKKCRHSVVDFNFACKITKNFSYMQINERENVFFRYLVTTRRRDDEEASQIIDKDEAACPHPMRA